MKVLSSNLRDRVFRFDGQSLLVDTAVLPTLQSSKDGGESWTQGGESIQYLASRFDIADDDIDAYSRLRLAWNSFLASL